MCQRLTYDFGWRVNPELIASRFGQCKIFHLDNMLCNAVVYSLPSHSFRECDSEQTPSESYSSLIARFLQAIVP